jgi:hypothetical protein
VVVVSAEFVDSSSVGGGGQRRTCSKDNKKEISFHRKAPICPREKNISSTSRTVILLGGDSVAGGGCDVDDDSLGVGGNSHLLQGKHGDFLSPEATHWLQQEEHSLSVSSRSEELRRSY